MGVMLTKEMWFDRTIAQLSKQVLWRRTEWNEELVAIST